MSSSIGGGSGIWIAPGLILTNEHVVRNASSMTIVLADGSRYRVEQTATTTGHDLAVLRVSFLDGAPLQLDSGPASPGKGVVAICGPHFPSVAQCRIGIIDSNTACLQRELDPRGSHDYSHLVRSTAELQPGFSGGPLIDENGRVIGISVAASGNGQNARGYAIPMSKAIRAVIDELCRKAQAPDSY